MKSQVFKKWNVKCLSYEMSSVSNERSSVHQTERQVFILWKVKFLSNERSSVYQMKGQVFIKWKVKCRSTVQQISITYEQSGKNRN